MTTRKLPQPSHYADRNAGTGLNYTVSNLMLSGIDASNYRLAGSDTANGSNGVITRAALTLAAVGSSKTYDGTTGSAALPSATGLQGTDAVAGLVQTFDNRNVGSGKTLTVQSGYVVNDGNGGNNYTITTLGHSGGAITPAALILAAASVSKTYDAGLSADASPLVTGLHGADAVTGLTQKFLDRHAGSDKSLQINGGYLVNDGNGGNNYLVSIDNSATGTITPATLTLTAAGISKTYDATTAAAAVPIASGLMGSDTVTGMTESYADKHAGSGKTLQVNDGFVVTDGNNGNNYTVVKVDDMEGEILRRSVTVVAPDNVTKEFDGTTSVPFGYTPTVVGGIGEGVQAALLQYATPDVATGKTVDLQNVVMSDGNGGNNYLVTAQASHTGVIVPAPVPIPPVVNPPAPPTPTPTVDVATPATITVSPVASVQRMVPVGLLQAAIDVTVTVNGNQTEGFILLSDVRQSLPEIAAITHVAGPGRVALPAGARFDSLDGRVVFDASTVLPQYLMMTGLDHENRLRQVKLLLIPKASDDTPIAGSGAPPG